jgi:hypothetical protein
MSRRLYGLGDFTFELSDSESEGDSESEIDEND